MRVALAAAFVLAFATLAPAQTFRGGIQGTVTDQTDAALPGTTVTVTNVGTGLTRSTTTDTSGSYLLSELPLGEYSVAANLQGFATQTVTGVIVEASVNQRIDMQLRPGGVQEAIEVRARSPLVETTRNVQGGTIEGEQAAELPLNGRDWTQLATLQPGVVSSGRTGGVRTGNGVRLAISGARPSENQG